MLWSENFVASRRGGHIHITDVELIHLLVSHLGVNCFEEGGRGVLAGLCQNDPSSARVSYHELGHIVDPTLDDDPAVPHLDVLFNFRPLQQRHPSAK
jgi:hypothetical protein